MTSDAKVERLTKERDEWRRQKMEVTKAHNLTIQRANTAEARAERAEQTVTALLIERDQVAFRAERAKAALREIEKVQPAVLAYIRDNGFVFDTPLDKSDDQRTEAERWEKLAFSIYSDLCNVDSLVRSVLEDEESEHG